MMTEDTLNDLYSLTWPASRIGEAIEVVARKVGFLSYPVDVPLPNVALTQDNQKAQAEWIELIAFRLGIESEPVEASYNDVLEMIRKAGPALLRLPSEGEKEPRFLALLSGGRWWVSVMTPQLTVRWVRATKIQAVLVQKIEAPVAAQIDQLLLSIEVPAGRRTQAKRAILQEQLSGIRISGCWLLRLSPSSSLSQQIYHSPLLGQLLIMGSAYLIQQVLLVFSGWMIIEEALDGLVHPTWLFAWGFLLCTTLFFQALVLSSQNALAIGIGALFKNRLLFGTLQLEPEEIRHQGVGQFLGRVMESQSAEMLALGGGFIALISLIQLFMAGVILALGAGGSLHVLLLIGWFLITLLLGWRYARRSQTWITSYREMTNDLVERMVGHRTRLVQEDIATWHEEEDQLLSHYVALSKKLDQTGIQLSTFVKRGWLIIGLAGMALTFLDRPTSSIQLAITLGGIILASGSLESFVSGITSIVEVVNAWGEFSPLFEAATRAKQETFKPPVLLTKEETLIIGQPVILARDLLFRYRNYGEPIIDGLTLRIGLGERILLEGPSGGGKSTLAALLAGLRTPQAGMLLLQGLDMEIVGAEAWRKRVVSAPQFHENHVLTDTFAFNLLMGCAWPPTPEDLQEAELICHELGLGNLLARMPSGMQQMIGESGWQLSHGERSRLYIARALLQKADLIILDESFAALDPENLQLALECVFKRAQTLLVIAHP